MLRAPERTPVNATTVAYSRDVRGDHGAGGVDAALMRVRVLARMFDEHEPQPQIDRFELLEELGRGGMGRIYLAYDPRLRRKVALERLHSDSDKAEHGELLLREAQGLARLAHPNIVPVFEVGESGAGV